MKNKLLSICIPTYNRAEVLKLSLSAILKGASEYQNEIEVIVSDNASTDGTQEVLRELKKEYPFLNVFKNESNLGPNGNFFKLSDEYASGKYFWLIGDDDVVDSNSIDTIIKVLSNHKDVSFLGLNFRILPINDIISLQPNDVDCNIQPIKMRTLLNKQCRGENLLATFISCNIILLDKFKNFDKSIFSNDSWSNYKNLFPHAHIIASVVSSNEKTIYISEPLISVVSHDKEWDDRLALIYLYYIIDVYKYYIESGFKKTDIRHSKMVIIDAGFGSLIFSKAQFKYKLNFLKFALRDFYFYKLIFTKAIRKTIKK